MTKNKIQFILFLVHLINIFEGKNMGIKAIMTTSFKLAAFATSTLYKPVRNMVNTRNHRAS